MPLRRDSGGKIYPSFRWRECTKRIIVCTKWETKTVFFKDLEWFLINGWDLKKRKSLVK